MKTDDDFKMMVAYFWNEKGDPTRFVDWDEARCERVWPEFLSAYRQYKTARSIMVLVANSIEFPA